MSEQGGQTTFAGTSDVVLYDIMCDTATTLGSRLVALERAAEAADDHGTALSWRDRHYAVADECEAIDPTDRAAQIAAILAWENERNRLPDPPVVDGP